MLRFSSLQHAPPETRRILRQRLQRYLGHEHSVHSVPSPDAALIDDEAMLRLLQGLVFGFGNDWSRMLAGYQAELTPGSGEPSFADRLAEGWGRVIWGRVNTSLGVERALRQNNLTESALSRVMKTRFTESYELHPDSELEGELLATAQRLERGEIAIHRLRCRSPGWVAARLWDSSVPSNVDHQATALRWWVDRWIALGSPEVLISNAWDTADAERFRGAAFAVIETDKALEGWEESRFRFGKSLALELGRPREAAQKLIPGAPQTLVDRALWLLDHQVERFAHESLREVDEILGLLRLLLTDIESQAFSGAPHPLAARLFSLATNSPDVLFHLILSVRQHPRLLADLLLYPPTCALACLMIGQWHFHPSAYDRELTLRSDQLAKAVAFEDAVSVLAWWLEKGLTPPAEAAAVLEWLHQSAGTAFIDDRGGQEAMRVSLHNEVLTLDPNKLKAMYEDLRGKYQDHDQLTRAAFAAALEVIAIGGLENLVDAAPLVESYTKSLNSKVPTPSVHRLGLASAKVLFRVAEREPELLRRFLYPVDVPARLAEGDAPDANPYIVARAVESSLRVHIRVLARAVAGGSEAGSKDLITALTAAVRTGALADKSSGRVAAFAPRHEASIGGASRDRPIAHDLAAAMRALSEHDRTELLSAILETNEPMLLAQMLLQVPRAARTAIEQRLETLPPDEAGTTYSLVEVQTRIEELLAAGAFGAAERFIQEEERLKTLGKVQGREVVRLRASMRLHFARREWAAIMAAQVPAEFERMDREAADEILQFFKGLTLLVRPENRDPAAAESIFQALHRRKPTVAAYRLNVIAAQIGTLLPNELFGRLDEPKARRAQQILAESRSVLAESPALSHAEREGLACNQALLSLALGNADQALEFLQPEASSSLDAQVPAYRAAALVQLGRTKEAVAVLKAAEDSLGRSEVLEAAWAHVREGAPFSGTAGVSTNDDPTARIREAFRDLHLLDPIQQASVVSLAADPLYEFVVGEVRGAAASIVALVPAMDVVSLDGCEDDVTSVIRELLLSRLEFLRWSVSDQSKRGFSARGNPGEPDLNIMRGSTVLAVIEAVVCRNPIQWETVQKDLRAHFVKLLGYGTCRLFFHLTYLYDSDIQGVIDHLKTVAGAEAPAGFKYLGATDIRVTDSRPHGFVARYNEGQGELRAIFLVLDMGQRKQRSAAAAARG
jgi:hypothetical protein